MTIKKAKPVDPAAIQAQLDEQQAALTKLQTDLRKGRGSDELYPIPPPPPLSHLAETIAERQARARREREAAAEVERARAEAEWRASAPHRERIARDRAKITAAMEAKQRELVELERQLGQVK